LEIGVVVLSARECASADRRACRHAGSVDVWRRVLVAEGVCCVVHEAGDAPRPVAPAQTPAPTLSRNLRCNAMRLGVTRTGGGVEIVLDFRLRIVDDSVRGIGGWIPVR